MTRIMQLTSYGALNATTAMSLAQQTHYTPIKIVALSCLVTAGIATIVVFFWYMTWGTRDTYISVLNDNGKWQIARRNPAEPLYVGSSIYETQQQANFEIKRIRKMNLIGP